MHDLRTTYPDTWNENDTGQNMYEDYVTVRTNGNISLWAKVTRVGYKMFMSGNKITPIKLRDKTVDLKETMGQCYDAQTMLS